MAALPNIGERQPNFDRTANGGLLTGTAGAKEWVNGPLVRRQSQVARLR